MKTPNLPVLFLAIAAVLPSCVPIDPGLGYSTPYYDGGGYYQTPVYPAYGGLGGYSSPYYGGVGRARCNACGYSPCRCATRRVSPSRYGHDDHDHDHRSSSSKKDSHGRITLLGGGGSANRPQGTHNREWYEKRGYDLKDYKYKDEAGHVHNKKKK
jgi:hypothetical protein